MACSTDLDKETEGVQSDAGDLRNDHHRTRPAPGEFPIHNHVSERISDRQRRRYDNVAAPTAPLASGADARAAIAALLLASNAIPELLRGRLEIFEELRRPIKSTDDLPCLPLMLHALQYPMIFRKGVAERNDGDNSFIKDKRRE